MSTKTLGVVGRGSGWQKVGIELGSFIFYPNSSQPGMFQTFAIGTQLVHPSDEGAIGPTMDFMEDFCIYSVAKKLVACEQLVATGGPWVTHQCLGNQVLMIFLFLKPKLDHHGLRKVKSKIDLF